MVRDKGVCQPCWKRQVSRRLHMRSTTSLKHRRRYDDEATAPTSVPSAAPRCRGRHCAREGLTRTQTMKAVPGHGGLWASEDGAILSDRSGVRCVSCRQVLLPCRLTSWRPWTNAAKGASVLQQQLLRLSCVARVCRLTDRAPHVRAPDARPPPTTSPANVEWGTLNDNAAGTPSGTRNAGVYPGERRTASLG